MKSPTVMKSALVDLFCVSRFHCRAPQLIQAIKKHPAEAECFLKFDEVEIISWSFESTV